MTLNMVETELLRIAGERKGSIGKIGDVRFGQFGRYIHEGWWDTLQTFGEGQIGGGGGKPLRGRALPYMVKKARIGWGCPAFIGRLLGGGDPEQRLCSYNTLQAGCQLHSVFGARSVGCAAVSHPKIPSSLTCT